MFTVNFKKPTEQIERTLILTPFTTAACAQLARPCLKCVGEVNVIDPLQRRLKQKRSHVLKRVIFFMNREKKFITRSRCGRRIFIDRARWLWKPLCRRNFLPHETVTRV